MNYHYVLWAFGKDRPGIVASVTEILFKNNCNLEDSSMMRLGSEFAILLIFTSKYKISQERRGKLFSPIEKRLALTLGIKPISSFLAKFQPFKGKPYIVSVYGYDRPGIVFQVTSLLSKLRFNITDLATHRTTWGDKPGYILFIEGELPGKIKIKELNV